MTPRDELCMAFSASWLHSEWLHNNRDALRAPLICESLLGSMPEHGRHVLRRMSAGDVTAAAAGGGYSNAHNDLGEGPLEGVEGYVSHCPCPEYQGKWAAAALQGYDWRAHAQATEPQEPAEGGGGEQQARL